MKRLIFATLLAWTAWSAICDAQPYGIDTRYVNTTLLISQLPASEPGMMQKEQVFTQLAFSKPVLLTGFPDNTPRLAVVEKRGTIKVFDRTSNPGSSDVEVLLDISGQVLNSGEQGMLGLAFSPDYETTGRFYVCYSWNGTDPGTTRVSRFTNATPVQNYTDPATEEILIEIPQPYTNHNAGMIAFGPDSMLYIAVGDGGSGGDPLNSGQDTTTLLGSILRIDVDTSPDPGLEYHIPSDNPFFSGGPAGSATRKEIYAYGLRNPWRFSFDRLNGYLLAGDVGQGAREEIDAVKPGRNYGWKIMEGMICYNAASCNTGGLTLPLVDYGRDEGFSVTGGYVYYGDQVPSLYGMYIYGDYGTGRIWGLRYNGTSISGPYTLISSSGLNISGFGQDNTGEVYLLDYISGRIYVLRPVFSSGDFPSKLSDIPALLASGSGTDQTAQGIIAFEPAAQLWSDGTLKERFMALPGLDQVGYREAGGWDFPENSILIKNFILAMDERDPENTARRLETRMLYRKNSQWHGFSFEWNEQQTDADLLWNGKTRTYSIIDTQGNPLDIAYLYPSRNQCIQCHTNAANGVLGPNTPQMNTAYTFPASGITDNQLRTYDHISLFTQALPAPPDQLPRMPDPMDQNASLQERARAYLAANCAMCHQPDGPAPTSLDLRWEVSNGQMNAIDLPPGNGNIGINNPLIISTRGPGRSVLLKRMGLRDGQFQMPPLGTSRPDAQGIGLIRDWMISMGVPIIQPQQLLLLID